MRTTIVVTAFATFLAGCVHTPQVEKVDRNWDGNGVLYALPRTALDATFEVSKVDFKKPECPISEATANALDLDIEHLSNDPRTVFAVHSGALASRPIPDSDKVYVMRFPEHSNWADTSMLTTLNAQGIIESAEGKRASKAVEIGTKVLEFGVSVGLGLMPSGNSKADDQSNTSCNVQDQIDEYESLKESKLKFRNGPTFPSGDTLTLFLAQIDVKMASIQAKFTGKASIQKDTIQCSVSPNGLGDTTLFKVDVKRGFNLNPVCTMLGGSIPDNAILTEYNTVMVNVEELELQQLHQAQFNDLHASAPDLTDIGFVYNVPVDALVSITGHPKALVAKTTVTMPQLGEIGFLPRVKGNSPSLSVSLHPDSGALKTASVTNDAADIGAVLGALSTSTTSYFTTRQAIAAQEAADAAAEAAKLDELNVLTRERSLLEARVAIYTAKDALEQWEAQQ